jgi:glycerophosphoryl diester phosphodiesterase
MRPKKENSLFFLAANFLLCCSFIFSSCGRPSPLETNIQFLGHKGSGNNNYNDVLLENTVPSVQGVLSRLDGAEIDVQMSLDGTIWIFHNSSLSNSACINSIQDTIPKMRDTDIELIRICHKNKSDRLYRLAELVNWANTTPEGFYLSLDIKVSFNAGTFALYGNKDGYLAKFADALALIFVNYKFTDKVLVEIDSKFFCNLIKNHKATNKMTTCFMRYEAMPQKIENAIKLGYDGLSCNYTDVTVTKENIEIAHSAGLKVQLWTPYYRDELRKAFAMNPDFIQTDNIYAKQALNVK